jgi:hypothetical protein
MQGREELAEAVWGVRMEGVLGYEVWLNPLLPRFLRQGIHQGLGYPNQPLVGL